MKQISEKEHVLTVICETSEDRPVEQFIPSHVEQVMVPESARVGRPISFWAAKLFRPIGRRHAFDAPCALIALWRAFRPLPRVDQHSQ